MWSCRDGVRKAKAHLELKQVRDVKVSKEDFCRYIHSKESRRKLSACC